MARHNVTRPLDTLTFTRTTDLGMFEYRCNEVDVSVIRDEGGWALYEYSRQRFVREGFRTVAAAKNAIPTLLALGHLSPRR